MGKTVLDPSISTVPLSDVWLDDVLVLSGVDEHPINTIGRIDTNISLDTSFETMYISLYVLSLQEIYMVKIKKRFLLH